jgi:prefoldin subunit 5
MADKIQESIDTQMKQLEEFQKQYELLRDAINQLRGSLAALEFVRNLNSTTKPDTSSQAAP